MCLEDDLSSACEAAENDSEDPCLVETPMGTLHLKMAEAIYLNEKKHLELKPVNEDFTVPPSLNKAGHQKGPGLDSSYIFG